MKIAQRGLQKYAEVGGDSKSTSTSATRSSTSVAIQDLRELVSAITNSIGLIELGRSRFDKALNHFLDAVSMREGLGLLDRETQRQYKLTQLHIQPKALAVSAFLAWIETLSTEDLIVYSDGSRSQDGAAGYGYIIHRNKQPIGEGLARLGPVEVFDAEVAGALAGLRHATTLVSRPGTQIYICPDNTSAAAGLLGQPSESSQAQFLEFQLIARAHGATSVRWCPGHKGIPGNEQADKLAKAGTELPEPPDTAPSLAFN